jgi:ankyrin repeat protein
MAKRKNPTLKTWFRNCGGFGPSLDLDQLQDGLDAGFLDEQDEWGMTALSQAVMSQWLDGVQVLLGAGANTELRYYRTGETPLHMIVRYFNSGEVRAQIIAEMLKAGANPDAGDYSGGTPRESMKWLGVKRPFPKVRKQPTTFPALRIQNAEHLADHYYPSFKIPDEDERQTLKTGQAVDLIVYGPKSGEKQERVKVRITARTGRGAKTRYTADVETPPEQIHLLPTLRVVEFRPEQVVTVYIPKRKNR